MRSVRSKTKINRANSPTANALTCTTATPGRAATCRVAKIIHRGAVCSLTVRRNNRTASHVRPAKRPIDTAKPTTARLPICTSRLTPNKRPQKTTTPSNHNTKDAGCKPPTSRRITRKGGTLANCSMGATPNAAIKLNPTPTPVSAGHHDAAGKAVFTKPASKATNTQCTDQPIRMPNNAPTRPTAKNSSMKVRAMVRCDKPSTRNIAQASS